MATVDQIIANAIATANEQVALADAAADAAIDASNGYSSSGVDPIVFNLTAVEPDVPSVVNGTQTYESQLDRLVELASSQFALFFTTYYPLAADAFDEATNWLVNTITNGGTGISAAVEEQIWQRGRDRVIAEGTRASSQIVADFAGRGFSIPPGAMAGKLKELRLTQQQANNSFSRDVAVKQAEIEIETIRFAVGKAIESRAFAMQAAADYIRAIMSAPDAAARVAVINSDVQAKMISATSDLYRARLSRDELVLKSQEANLDANVKANAIDVNAFYQGIDARVRAAVGAAGVYGNAAGAALSSLNSLVSSAEVTNN
jgi:hypothetical protein